MKIRLSVWAKQQGVSFATAQRWFYAGKIPNAEYSPSGRVMIVIDEKPILTDEEACVIYARVSSSEQRGDLKRQIDRLRLFASGRGWKVTAVVEEIGSGLNGERRELVRLLSDSKVTRILVEHRERLARFGVPYIEAALMAQQRAIVVADESETQLDLVQDFVDVVTSMCARIYGRRSAKNRAKAAISAAEIAK
jgi:putative resolvase